MQRVFLKKIGRFDVGRVADYPKQTWDKIARDIGMALDKFSQPVLDVVSAAVSPPSTKGSKS